MKRNVFKKRYCPDCKCLMELADKMGITPANLSILKNNKAKAIRFSTLDQLCKLLDCQPADILEFREE